MSPKTFFDVFCKPGKKLTNYSHRRCPDTGNSRVTLEGAKDIIVKTFEDAQRPPQHPTKIGMRPVSRRSESIEDNSTIRFSTIVFRNYLSNQILREFERLLELAVLLQDNPRWSCAMCFLIQSTWHGSPSVASSGL